MTYRLTILDGPDSDPARNFLWQVHGMRGKTLLCGGAICCSLLFAAMASAIGTPEDQGEDIFTLGEVVVTERLGGIEAAQTVHEITAAEIKRLHRQDP